eukprot:1355103-Amorphochlora_amoeboformis.AAC.1
MDEKEVSASHVSNHMCELARRSLGLERDALEIALAGAGATVNEFVKVEHARRLIISRLDKKGSKPEIRIHADVRTGQRTGDLSVSVMFIKSVPTLRAKIPLGHQIYICQIKDTSPYEAMLNFVRHAFLPYSRSIIATDKQIHNKMMVDFNVLRTVNSTLSELEISLLRCQQNINIPQIVLQVHPVVQAVVKCKKDGDKPFIDDLPQNLDMDKFLIELTNYVADWKKLISSVTSLDRDVSSGNTKEEIYFWLSMESTLRNINTQLRSRGVEFTFHVLNENQRWLATTGFREECNLAQCQEKVKTYSDLLRDFPIRNLIEAVTVENITGSITSIFEHIKGKKITKIKYPLKRAKGLVHTVSRDVTLQMRSLLMAKEPILVPYAEFKMTMQACKELFRTWEQKSEIFFDDLRQAARQRREDTGRDRESYKDLEILKKRILEIKKIRKEHHELLRVIESALGKDSIVKQSSMQQIKDAYEFLKG